MKKIPNNVIRNHYLTKNVLLSLLLLLQLLVFFSASTAFANSYKKVPTIRESTYKVLSSAQKHYKNNNPAKAIAILDKIKLKNTLNSYEKAMMWNQYGAIYYGLEQLDQAISSYEELLRQDNYPKLLKLKTLYNLAQLYFQTKQYHQVTNRLNKWFALTDAPTEQAYALQAQAYYYLENHQQVVNSINKALDLVDQKSVDPDEQWMVLMQSSLEELGLEKHRLSILKWMVRIFPTKDYMLSLASAYATLEKQKEQLAVMELAYKKGFLDTERLQLVLATLFYAQGVPYKAAQVIQRGIDNNSISKNSQNYKLLSNCLRASQEFEKALPPLIQSATLSGDAETYYLLATTYYQLGRWEEAITAFTTALEKGLTHRAQRAWILLGQTYMQRHQFDQAINSFTRASTFEDTQKIAQRWIRYAELESDRHTVLQTSEKELKGISLNK